MTESTMAPDFSVEILTDDDLLLQARRLRGERYLRSGFVDELSAEGVIEDPWVSISTYFGAIDPSGAVIGVSRLIPYTDVGLPALDAFDLSPVGRDMLAAVSLDRLAEVSALAVTSDQSVARSGRVASALYRAMSQYSLVSAGHTHWCAALDQRVKAHLMRSYGFLFEDIGEATTYLGSPTVPVLLDLYGQARHFALTMPERNEYFLAGLVVDLTGDEVRVTADTGEFLPAPSVQLNG